MEKEKNRGRERAFIEFLLEIESFICFAFINEIELNWIFVRYLTSVLSQPECIEHMCHMTYISIEHRSRCVTITTYHKSKPNEWLKVFFFLSRVFANISNATNLLAAYFFHTYVSGFTTNMAFISIIISEFKSQLLFFRIGFVSHHVIQIVIYV